MQLGGETPCLKRGTALSILHGLLSLAAVKLIRVTPLMSADSSQLDLTFASLVMRKLEYIRRDSKSKLVSKESTSLQSHSVVRF